MRGWIAAALLALLPALAHAGEHITLRNGFELDCRSHETVDAAHTRMYLNAERTSYQDILTVDVLRIEAVADAPAPPAASPVAKPSASDDVHGLLAAAGAEHHIDTALLASIVRTESAGHPHAVSRAGAGGLMQLMPGTAREMGVNDVFRADENIHGGTAYLDALLTRYGNDPLLALAAYNAGPGAVDRYHGIPPFRETRAYVARVMHDYNRLKAAEIRAAKAASVALGSAVAVVH